MVVIPGAGPHNGYIYASGNFAGEDKRMPYYSVLPPWRPMVEAPKDGTLILILFNEGWCHADVCAWGEYDSGKEGWFHFDSEVGDWDHAVAVDEDGDTDGGKYAAAWLPFPEWLKARIDAR
jgi:hypothetical protein